VLVAFGLPQQGYRGVAVILSVRARHIAEPNVDPTRTEVEVLYSKTAKHLLAEHIENIRHAFSCQYVLCVVHLKEQFGLCKIWERRLRPILWLHNEPIASPTKLVPEALEEPARYVVSQVLGA
jgi:hypothetical protein